MIREFLKSRSKWAHGLAAAGLGLCTLIVSDQHFRDKILTLFAHHPDIGSELVIVAGIVVTYMNFKKGNQATTQNGPPETPGGP